MTDDYKKILLEYITNLIPGQATTGEIFQSVNEVARSEWIDYIPDKWVDFTLEGAIKSNSSDVIVFYGGYVEYNGTYANNSKGIIIITDNLLNPIQTIYEYDTGTDLRPITCMIQEEDGQFVAVDSKVKYYQSLSVRQLFYSCEKRFIMLNDLSIPIDNTYYARLRKSYVLGSSYTNFVCKDMYKNPNSSHYLMTGIKLDTNGSYNPAYVKVINLVINVGSANTWGTVEGGSPFIYGGSYCYFDNSDNAQWKMLVSSNSNSDKTIRCWKGTNATETGLDTLLTLNYKTRIDEFNYYCQSVFINQNFAYFVLTNQRWGISGTPDAKYMSLYSYDFSTGNANEIYFKSLGNYDFCDIEQIQLQAVNGELYIEYITNIDTVNNTADYYVQRFEGVWNPILVKEAGYYILSQRAFYVSQDFNLLKIYCLPVNLRIATWNMIDITEIYSSINYNGQPYDNYNSLIGEYGNVYSNGELVFSRDLYNISTTNNYTVSTLEIPNTYLNGISLSPKDLIGKTNVNLVNDTPTINKNIYEVLFLNYVNTINVIDNEQDVISSTGKYINTNINVGTQTNQENTKCSKVFITWEDSSTKNFSIGWTSVDDTHSYTEFTIYIEQNVSSIELMSNDLSTTYITLNTDGLEVGKYYTFKQYLKVE